MEGQTFLHRPYREVLDELIQIATSPVRQALDNHPVSWSAQLIRHACRLLARVVAELAAQACSTDVSEIFLSGIQLVHGRLFFSRIWTLAQPEWFTLRHHVSPLSVKIVHGTRVTDRRTPSASQSTVRISASLVLGSLEEAATTTMNWS